MSLINCSRISSKITHALGLVLLCVGYFNSFLISEPISIFFQISSWIGRLLVDRFLVICSLTVDIVKISFSFFQIVYEDFLMFVKDVTEKFTFALSLLKECYLYLEMKVNFCLSCGWEVTEGVFEVFSVFCGFGVNVFKTFAFAIQTLKDIGTIIWNTFTTIPDQIVDALFALFGFIALIKTKIVTSIFEYVDKIIEAVESTLMVFLDIQLDSIFGLILGGIVALTICFNFKVICQTICNVILKLCQRAVSVCVSLWTGRFLEYKRSFYNAEDDERLCIICQYQVKEIIFFPCKHLCMCWDCSCQIMRAQQTCPVCRSNIQETVKVYV